MYKEPPYHKEGNIQEKAVMMIMLIEDHIGIRDPLKEGDIPGQSGRPPDQRAYPDRGSPRRGYPNRDGRPPRRGGYPGDGGPPDGGGPPG